MVLDRTLLYPNTAHQPVSFSEVQIDFLTLETSGRDKNEKSLLHSLFPILSKNSTAGFAPVWIAILQIRAILYTKP